MSQESLSSLSIRKCKAFARELEAHVGTIIEDGDGARWLQAIKIHRKFSKLF